MGGVEEDDTAAMHNRRIFYLVFLTLRRAGGSDSLCSHREFCCATIVHIGQYSNNNVCKTVQLAIIKPFPEPALVFTCLQYKRFENTMGKGEIARNEQFLLFPVFFYPFGKLSAIFIKFKIVVCKHFEF